MIDEIDERIEKYSERITESGCRIWTGSTNQDGYGHLNINKKTTRVTRLIYEREKGKIPEGQYVLHTCDTPQCININHLYLGTQFDNMQDRAKRGRFNQKGKSNNNWKHGRNVNA